LTFQGTERKQKTLARGNSFSINSSTTGTAFVTQSSHYIIGYLLYCLATYNKQVKNMYPS